ncbi:polyprenol phosphomannose-dependent alpha 1,6 mannosyltransferase MptB [Phycicoccus sp. CSK15P-2]|uniref:polyprenol phosphomannose-dependent alpha 1,6 mannosyltransferase MptB n=1 Tax=Phycicoccus sp. CSK15P-2 TaxID=2807627 RepID=UPI001952353B|nr:polyprenol phosphomannose-dependent alpha 1,6 mannosyltransferase MptB [Phycicoccus sp. CSK15P-2]MBM6403430.1 polyprenol phosphomannose-dependent alpha 1,6 mannosyltransferase MptB [Phycicoccus sp. CSK15P-2]
MAPGLSAPRPPGRTDGVRRALLVVSLGLLLLVGASRPNAAQPDLLPRGWAPGPLVPVDLGPGVVTAVLWAAYLAGAAAVYLGLRGPAPALRGWRVPGAVGVLALLTAPFGSADHISYLAYGRILVTGGDPWVEAPAAWAGGADPVTSRVEAPWTEEPSVYGPFATLLHALSAWVGGDSLREGVWMWQVLVVLSWLAVRAALRSVLPVERHARVDVLWTLNPLVLGVGVLGAHVDVVAAALVLAAVVVAVRLPEASGALGAGALVGLAGSAKATYAVAALALAAAWWLLAGPRTAAHRLLTVVVGMALAAVPLHLWAGTHVYDQLGRSRQAVSLATPWRPLLEGLGGTVGPFSTRTLISAGAALLAVVLLVALWRLLHPSAPSDAAAPSDPTDTTAEASLALVTLPALAALELAYVLAASYSLPWYDILVWAALPAALAGGADLVALARTTVAALAYVPGRVLGMTPAVEELTLGFRRSAAPWLVLAVWVLALVLSAGVARRGSGRPLVPRRAGSPPSPTR